jgi:hypothetical protein
MRELAEIVLSTKAADPDGRFAHRIGDQGIPAGKIIHSAV